jgi:type III restriction enzyme
MARKKANATDQMDAFDITGQLKTAICVPAIRESVRAWKSKGLPGITDTTRELINYWFYTDHKKANGKKFTYYKAQQEAMETLIYIHEVEGIKNRKELYTKFAYQSSELRIPAYDEFARYAIKMATGSGKTKVMAMAIVWQMANAMHDPESYASNFLILAPNVIVFERLKKDFMGGAMFRTDPLIPKHLKWLLEIDYYMRGDTERGSSTAALYLTNIQQFYERGNRKQEEESEEMTGVLGDIPPANKTELSDFDVRIAKRDGLLMVLNDEAHHTHDEESQWNQFIRRMHENKTINIQLDFSATPRYSKGSLFAWTISDYPLKQAIMDQIVKRPIKGISHIQEAKSDIASTKYEGFLVAGVKRWEEYHKLLKPLSKKPILFIMMNDTKEADDVGDWLQSKYPDDFGGKKTLVIHTDSSGEVSKKDLDEARVAAREVDAAQSRVNAIVSVLMLREGWDVQNVTVVVGLRPYTSKANILPEQTIGRGLRLMFQGEGNGYTERVDIIGNQAFMDFVLDLEKLENLHLDTFEIGKDKLNIQVICPIEDKQKYDIAFPDISAILSRKKSLAEEIGTIDVMQMSLNPIPYNDTDVKDLKTFIYEGRDILTDEVLLKREFSIPEAQTVEEVIGYYARKIANEVKLPSHFAVLAPKVKEFLQYKAFGQEIDMTDKSAVKAISSKLAHYVTIKEFVKELRAMVIEEKEPILSSDDMKLSSTKPFPTSKLLYEGKKSVYNYVVCDNEYERAFAKFLDTANDVAAFAKLTEQFGFCIPYTDTRANLRNYYPDFVAIGTDGTHYLIETKGRDDLDVLQKDKYAIIWCEKASALCKVNWIYIKVMQRDYEDLHPDNMLELLNMI